MKGGIISLLHPPPPSWPILKRGGSLGMDDTAIRTLSYLTASTIQALISTNQFNTISHEYSVSILLRAVKQLGPFANWKMRCAV